MAPHQPIAHGAPVPSGELLRLLRRADESLGQLTERALAVVALDDPVSMGFCPKQMQSLCRMLGNSRARIQGHILNIEGPAASGNESPGSSPPLGKMDPISFIAKYRASCRMLCEALNEARRASQAPAGAMLSDIILRLEKQLWIMDSPKQTRRTDQYRSVSLFLAC
jgi:hypothetical protein